MLQASYQFQSSSIPIEKLEKLMWKVEMLHTQSIDIASMTKQFQTNNETKNALLVAQINITQQKHKAKIVNIKQASRDLGVRRGVQNKSKS